jgi:hypothetical protein
VGDSISLTHSPRAACRSGTHLTILAIYLGGLIKVSMKGKCVKLFVSWGSRVGMIQLRSRSTFGFGSKITFRNQ